MAAVPLKLFVDTTNRRLVTGPTNAAAFVISPWFQEDKVNLEIQFLTSNPTAGYPQPFLILDPTGFALTVKLGTIGGTILAAQSTWAIGTNVLTGILDLNTAEMVTAMSGGLEITRKLEFELDDITTFQADQVIKPELILTGSPSPGAPSQYYTKAETDAAFIRAGLNPANFFPTFVSPDGTKTRTVGVNDDGSAMDE